MAPDYSALLVLYVDSDPTSLLAFRDAVAPAFAVATAETGRDALDLLVTHDVAVIVSEQRLSDMQGVELLRRSRELRPGAARLLTTSTLDIATALDAINLSHVNGYLAKPWQREPLHAWLHSALDKLHVESTVQSMEMRLWHGGQVAAATTIYEELVHELSNPLGALEINASLVADQLQMFSFETGIGPELQASLESAREAQIDAMTAIDQIKGLVLRMRQGRPADRGRGSLRSRCDVVRVIDATVRIVRAEIEKVAVLEVQLESAPRFARIEASALGQVLLNLLLNAAQSVTPGQRGTNRVRVRALELAGQLELAVDDNGTGVAKEDVERIFEPFFTTKQSGTGLGLAICRELVSQFYGTIRVRSLAGGGTRFEVSVPLAKVD
jgi:two-component system, NtrC family, sensor kinase